FAGFSVQVSFQGSKRLPTALVGDTTPDPAATADGEQAEFPFAQPWPQVIQHRFRIALLKPFRFGHGLALRSWVRLRRNSRCWKARRSSGTIPANRTRPSHVNHRDSP